MQGDSPNVNDLGAREHAPHLVLLVRVPDEESQEVEPGAFPDKDEVRRPISQMGKWGQALRAPRTSTGHGGGVDGQELPTRHLPLFHFLCIGQQVGAKVSVAQRQLHSMQGVLAALPPAARSWLSF